MASKKPDIQKEYLDFRGGLVTKLSSYMIFDSQLAQTQDAVIHMGGIRKSSGHSAVFSSVPITSRGLSMVRVYDLVSGTKSIYQLRTGRLYRVSGASAAAIGSGFGNSAKMTYAMANRKLYVANGAVQVRGYSGAGSTAIFTPSATPPEIPRFLFYHQDSNRLFAGRGATTVNRVWFSDINAFETWPTNNFFDIPESRMGDRITGFARLLGRLVIFGERTISVLYGRVPSDYSLRTLEWSHGCPFPFTIAEYDGFILYLGIDGIYKFDGSGPSQKISEMINTSGVTGDINLTNENGPVAVRTNEGIYLLSYKSLTINTGNNVLQNDQELGVIPPSEEAPFWHFQGPNTRGFSMYSRWLGGGDAGETYAMSADTTGQMFRLTGRYLYNTTAIDMDVFTKQYDLGAPFIRKEFLEIEVHLEAETIHSLLNLYYRVDNNSAWMELGAIDMHNTGPVYGHHHMEEGRRGRIVFPFSIPEPNPVGNYIQLRFRQRGLEQAGTATQQQCNILGFAIRARRALDTSLR